MLNNLPVIAGTAVGLAGLAGLYYATYAVRSQWLGSTIWHGRTDTGSVALTFDDGPSYDTSQVLDILAENRVLASFFVVGRQVKRFPGLARRIVADGHEIGNHSYSHPIYLYRSPRETRRQLALTQHIIFDVTGVKPQFARPPCGVRSPAYFAATRELGLQTIQWSVAGFDWKRRKPFQIAEAILKNTKAGSIILMHDGDSAGKHDRQATVEAIPLILKGLQEKDLSVVSLKTLCVESEAETVPANLIKQAANGGTNK